MPIHWIALGGQCGFLAALSVKERDRGRSDDNLETEEGNAPKTGA